MSEPERRKKMISLRLSEAEYAVLKSQYRTHGARNISDLARLALQQIMQVAVVAPDSLERKVADLEDRIHSLECEFALLAERDDARRHSQKLEV